MSTDIITRNDLKNILNKTLSIQGADFVIESGISDIWKYQKWNSGIVECWGYTEVPSNAYTANGGYKQVTQALPSGLFITSPDIVIAKGRISNVVHTDMGFTSPNDANSIQTYLINRNTGAVTQAGRVYWNVKGRWRKELAPEDINIRYYGTAPNRAAATGGHGVSTVGNYVIFAGGDKTVFNLTNVAEAYNNSLVKTTLSTLSSARSTQATSVGNYALFAGGQAGLGQYSNIVDTYNTSLTKGTATNLSNVKEVGGTTTISGYALFAGGYIYSTGTSSGTYYNTVDTYNTSLTKGTATNLSTTKASIGATTIGNYALFGGGQNNDNYFTTIDTYNTSLTKGTATNLTGMARHAVSIGNYALFFETDGTVDAYNTSLTRTIATPLTEAWPGCAGTLQNYALIPADPLLEGADLIDVYNESLTKTTVFTPTAIKVGKPGTINNYILFPQSNSASEVQPGVVYVYTIT